jgi:hypothetical protein
MMGYTHYWESYAMTIPDEAVTVIKALLAKAYADGVVQLEYDDPRPPVVTAEEIRFNGVGENGHETFHFNVHDELRSWDGTPFDFCKTARKPYDALVMRVLIVLKYHLQDRLQVRSDGGFTEEWQQARDAMRDEYGITTYVSEELTAPRL